MSENTFIRFCAMWLTVTCKNTESRSLQRSIITKDRFDCVTGDLRKKEREIGRENSVFFLPFLKTCHRCFPSIIKIPQRKIRKVSSIGTVNRDFYSGEAKILK